MDGLDGKGQLGGWQQDKSIRDHVHIGYAYAAWSTNQWYGPAIRNQQWKLIEGSSGGPDQYNKTPKGSDEPLPGGIDEDIESIHTITEAGQRQQENETYLLFDLENDPNEQHNVASQFPEIVQSLVEKLKEYQKTYLPPQPEDPNCPFTGFVNTSMGPTWYVDNAHIFSVRLLLVSIEALCECCSFSSCRMPWCSEVVVYS